MTIRNLTKSMNTRVAVTKTIWLGLTCLIMSSCGVAAATPLTVPGGPQTPACPVAQQSDVPGQSVSQRQLHPQPPSSTSPTTLTSFCLTPQEQALGETVLHDPTLPDSLLIQRGITLTSGPSAAPRLNKAGAEQTALSLVSYPGKAVRSALLAELHDFMGYPSKGPLVWVIDVSPPSGVTMPDGRGGTISVKYEFIILNANPTQNSPPIPGLGVYVGS